MLVNHVKKIVVLFGLLIFPVSSWANSDLSKQCPSIPEVKRLIANDDSCLINTYRKLGCDKEGWRIYSNIAPSTIPDSVATNDIQSFMYAEVREKNDIQQLYCWYKTKATPPRKTTELILRKPY